MTERTAGNSGWPSVPYYISYVTALEKSRHQESNGRTTAINISTDKDNHEDYQSYPPLSATVFAHRPKSFEHANEKMAWWRKCQIQHVPCTGTCTAAYTTDQQRRGGAEWIAN